MDQPAEAFQETMDISATSKEDPPVAESVSSVGGDGHISPDCKDDNMTESDVSNHVETPSFAETDFQDIKPNEKTMADDTDTESPEKEEIKTSLDDFEIRKEHSPLDKQSQVTEPAMNCDSIKTDSDPGNSLQSAATQTDSALDLDVKVDIVPTLGSLFGTPKVATTAVLTMDVKAPQREDQSLPNRPKPNDVSSIPAHLRPPPTAPRSFGLRSSEFATPAPAPDVPKTPENYRASYDRYPSHRPLNTYNHMRGGEDLARAQAQNMHLQKEVDTMRHQNETMRKNIQQEIEKDTDEVLGPMMIKVFHEKVALEKQRAKLRQKELDLHHRNIQVEQNELFLTIGHRQLFFEFEERERQTMSEVQLEHARREGAANAIAKMKQDDIRISARRQELSIQEAYLEDRESLYKAQVRGVVEEKVREQLEHEMKDRESQIINEAYERGLKEGRDQGLKEAVQEARNDTYADGFHAGFQAQKALIAFRNGDLSHDSPELAFIMDPNHPNNLFNMGMQVGRREEAPKRQRALPVHATIFEQINGTSVKINGNYVLANGNSPPVNGHASSVKGPPASSNGSANHYNSNGPQVKDNRASDNNSNGAHVDGKMNGDSGVTNGSSRIKERHLYGNDNYTSTNGLPMHANGDAGQFGGPVRSPTAPVNGITGIVNGQQTPFNSHDGLESKKSPATPIPNNTNTTNDMCAPKEVPNLMDF
ncbi:hypothetical protein K504DRAFT_487064 [Pleomassaria siparia CBS 279.74]|uniref:Uncharacterized protein n=1 Tax=Pleomassaria siparia CBS 279.74 TaxID=1314801 RepID=A0A6G1KSA1_9PLEO|nr:hypothetical protein K504DRAFT_487064 [Pleomassaria siparia CBS 279.74]